MRFSSLLLFIVFFTNCKEKEDQNKLISSKIDCIVPESLVVTDTIILPRIEDDVIVMEIKQAR